MTVPDYLKNIFNLIQRAFPNGVPEDEYLALLSIIYPHMADENIVIVIQAITGGDEGAILNDVYLSAQKDAVNPSVVAAVQARLDRAGFATRILED